MKLIYIRSTMEPKNYSMLWSLLKQKQGEKIAPYVFKLKSMQTIKEYLDQEQITYEIYHEEGQKKLSSEKKQIKTKIRRIKDWRLSVWLQV